MGLSFGIIGGDRRQDLLAELLQQDRYPVYRNTPDAVNADVIILPLPLCREPGLLNSEYICDSDRLNSADIKHKNQYKNNEGGGRITTQLLFQQLQPGQRIFAGQVQEEQIREAAQYHLQITDYFAREELVIANAAATAEGAIQTAMTQADYSLSQQPCLILGYGRIGKILAARLQGIGAAVSVMARNPADRAWIQVWGWEALDLRGLADAIGKFSVIFNTIPAEILDEALLSKTRPDCLMIDLASVRGIHDTLSRSVIWARGLPGQLAPRTAAAAIRDVIYTTLREDRILPD